MNEKVAVQEYSSKKEFEAAILDMVNRGFSLHSWNITGQPGIVGTHTRTMSGQIVAVFTR